MEGVKHMVKTIRGHFRSGRFISAEKANIPECVEVYVIITDKAIDADTSKAQRQRESLERLVAANAEVDDEPFDDEFDAILAKRTNITRELEL